MHKKFSFQNIFLPCHIQNLTVTQQYDTNLNFQFVIMQGVKMAETSSTYTIFIKQQCCFKLEFQFPTRYTVYYRTGWSSKNHSISNSLIFQEPKLSNS